MRKAMYYVNFVLVMIGCVIVLGCILDNHVNKNECLIAIVACGYVVCNFIACIYED